MVIGQLDNSVGGSVNRGNRARKREGVDGLMALGVVNHYLVGSIKTPFFIRCKADDFRHMIAVYIPHEGNDQWGHHLRRSPILLNAPNKTGGGCRAGSRIDVVGIILPRRRHPTQHHSSNQPE